jgi:hypothetical protein
MNTRKNKPTRLRSKSLRKLRKYRRGGDGPLLDPFRPDITDNTKIIPTPHRQGLPNIYQYTQPIQKPEIIDGDNDSNSLMKLLENDWNNLFKSSDQSSGESSGESPTTTEELNIDTQINKDYDTETTSEIDSNIDSDAGIEQLEHYETDDLIAPRFTPSSAPKTIEIKSDIQPELLLKDIKELILDTDDIDQIQTHKINADTISDQQIIQRLSQPPEYINDIPIIDENIEKEILQNIGTLNEHEGDTYSETLAETPTEIPTETPSETPTEIPTEIPTETPTEIPTETSSETPADISTETPADISTETPTDISTETPADISTETPTETPAETPADISTETPTETQPTINPITIPINVPVTVTTTTEQPPQNTVGSQESNVGSQESTGESQESTGESQESNVGSQESTGQAYRPDIQPINFPEGESYVPQEKPEINLPAINFPMESIENQQDQTSSKTGGYRKKRTFKRKFY